MSKPIIWATDGSEDADRALPFALDLAKLTDSALLVVHADEHFAGGRSSGESLLADEPELEAKLRDRVEQIRKDGFAAELEILRGRQGTDVLIAKAARERGAAAIVVGTRGRGPMAGAVLGSVTQQLLHTSPCPILVVPVHAHFEAREPVRV
jgi:nucleotide-binding universal stress UspA family protein